MKVVATANGIFNEAGKQRVSMPWCKTTQGCSPSGQRRSKMKLDTVTFVRLRRLAPVLDDVLNAGEVEHADHAVDLASIAQLCSPHFDTYYSQHQDEIVKV